VRLARRGREGLVNSKERKSEKYNALSSLWNNKVV
jgi:hypothetical protein